MFSIFFALAMLALPITDVLMENKIQCFQCNIGMEFDPIPNCTNPAIVTCSSGYSKEYCYSAIVRSKINGSHIHVKACAHNPIDAKQPACESIAESVTSVVKKLNLEFESCATCDRDLCNIMGRGDIFLNDCTKIFIEKMPFIIFVFLNTMLISKAIVTI